MTKHDAIAHWERMAKEADEMAIWDDEHTGSGAAQRAKAETYRRAAQSVRLSVETGWWHCVCCLKPLAREVA